MTGTLEVVAPNPGAVAVEASALVVLDNKFNGMDLDRLVNRTVSGEKETGVWVYIWGMYNGNFFYFIFILFMRRFLNIILAHRITLTKITTLRVMSQ